MAPPLQALGSILLLLLLLLLLAASMLVADVSSPPSGCSFYLKHAGPNEQVHHITNLIPNSESSPDPIADTGSDLIWLQHDKCSSDPMECPCNALMGNMKCCHGHCMFERMYGEGSYARGFMTKVRTTIDLTIGCAVDFGCPDNVNEKDCRLYKAGGIVGLGRGSMSLLSQLRLEKKKFSFCLPDYLDPAVISRIKFGDHAAALSKKAGFGQVDFKDNPSKYYVNLKNVYFVEKNTEKVKQIARKDMDDSMGDGVMLIDSGASFSKLPEVAFDNVHKHVKKIMRNKVAMNPKPASETKNKGLTCYNLQELPKDMPEMVLQFDSGAEMRLPKERYMMLESSEICLAIIKADVKHWTLGNFQMQNTAMLFDLSDKDKPAGTLAFWPENCGALE